MIDIYKSFLVPVCMLTIKYEVIQVFTSMQYNFIVKLFNVRYLTVIFIFIALYLDSDHTECVMVHTCVGECMTCVAE